MAEMTNIKANNMDEESPDIYVDDSDSKVEKTEIREKIRYLAKTINSQVEHLRYDPILKRLGRYQIRMMPNGFYLIGTGPETMYGYTMHNEAVLDAIEHNLHVSSVSSSIEKGRVVMAVNALSIDLQS